MTQYVIRNTTALAYWTGSSWTPHPQSAARFDFATTAVLEAVDKVLGEVGGWEVVPVRGVDRDGHDGHDEEEGIRPYPG